MTKNLDDPTPPPQEPDYKTLYRQLIETKLREESVNIEQRQTKHTNDQILKESLYKDNQFNPIKYIDHLLNKHPNGFKTPMNDQGGDTVYRYDPQQGIWHNDGIPYTEQTLEKIMTDDTTTKMYTNTTKHLQVKTYTPPEQFQEKQEIIVLLNGSLNTQTMKLQPHNPNNNARNRLPINYNPEATCPNFTKFLSEVTPNNTEFLQEWLGYHLLKDYRYQRCLVLLGDGDNGKSTLLNTITAFLGPENTSTESLYRLTVNRFSPAELYGKLANIAADIGPDELRHTGTIKMLTGGDWITAERKNRDPFPYQNYAKLTFSCNQLPKTPDETLAFFKRFIVLVFNEPIPKEKQDPRLQEKLTTESELSGILNWALTGLKRCLERGRLAEPGDAAERKELYLAMSDPVTGFYNEHITEDRESFEIKQDVINAFFQYCKNKGFVPKSDRTFYEDFKKITMLRNYTPKLYTEEHPEGKQIAAWRGIQLTGPYQKTEYYKTKEEYQTKYGTQKTLDQSSENIDHIEDMDHPQTQKNSEQDEEGYKDPQYPQYPQYEQDKTLIDCAKTYLQNNGGKAETHDLVIYLRDKGYSFEDYKRLKQHPDCFTFIKTKVQLREDHDE